MTYYNDLFSILSYKWFGPRYILFLEFHEIFIIFASRMKVKSLVSCWVLQKITSKLNIGQNYLRSEFGNIFIKSNPRNTMYFLQILSRLSPAWSRPRQALLLHSKLKYCNAITILGFVPNEKLFHKNAFNFYFWYLWISKNT